MNKTLSWPLDRNTLLLGVVHFSLHQPTPRLWFSSLTTSPGRLGHDDSKTESKEGLVPPCSQNRGCKVRSAKTLQNLGVNLIENRLPTLGAPSLSHLNDQPTDCRPNLKLGGDMA